MRINIVIGILGLAFIACSQKLDVKQSNNSLFTAPIGVQTYSFRAYFPKDIPGTLDRIQAMGITEIEGGPGRLPAEEFKKLCDARNIKIASTGANFDLLKNNPEKVVADATALGAKYVMCAWVPHEKGQFSKADADHAIEVFTNAGKVLKKAGVTFCYHPHGYEFQPYENGTLLDYMIQSSDPDFVSYEMDVFWVHFGGGDPVKLLLKYPDRWKLLHVKDMKKGTKKDLTGGTDIENDVPLGTGELDIPGIIRAAKQIGIKHYFIEDESTSVLDQIPASIKYLKSLKA